MRCVDARATMTCLSAVTVALMLVLALAVPAVPAAGLGGFASQSAGVPPLLAIDDDHPLARDGAIERFEDDGVVRANLTRVNLGLTIAKSAGKAGLDGFHADLTMTYVVFTYREGLPRKLRVYVPDAYFAPRPARLAPVGDTSGPTAHLSPVRNATATSVTVTLREPGRYTYAVRWETGVYYDARHWAADLTENATGIELPSLRGGRGSWHPIPPERLAANTTVAIPESYQDPAVQYDTLPGAEARWVNVPSCRDPSEQRVCRFTRSNQTMVMSTAPDPPRVRYRTQSSPLINVESAINDARAALDRLRDTIAGWLDGGP